MELKSELEAADVEGKKLKVQVNSKYFYFTVTKVIEITKTYIYFLDRDSKRRYLLFEKIEDII